MSLNNQKFHKIIIQITLFALLKILESVIFMVLLIKKSDAHTACIDHLSLNIWSPEGRPPLDLSTASYQP